jgi:hypothetical protein
MEKEILTLDKLKKLKPESIFAKGYLIDSNEGCPLANTGRKVRWVAVRGWIHDWAIYCQNPHYAGTWSWERIQQMGDKIPFEECIKQLVPCDEEAFKMYRY